MTKAEQKILDWVDRHKLWLFAGAISVLAALIRLCGLDFHSGDYDGFLRPWYDTIKANGGLRGLGEQVGNYNVLYQLCIALMTYLPIHPLTAYKGLSVLFDYLLAACAGLVVMELTQRDRAKAVAAYAVVLLAPSVFFDSAYWAQCDSIYCFFLLLCVYCLLRGHDLAAFLFAAVAFQFKLQAIFILPFLLCYYLLSRRFTILYFLIIPLLGVPLCLACGRAPFESLTIYLQQTGQHNGMTLSFPNVWNLISDNYDTFGRAAVLLAAGALGVWLLLALQRRPKLTGDAVMFLLITSVWTCLMFLPNMHERYGYFLNVLMVIAAVCHVKLAGYAAALEILTMIMYAKCFWKGSAAYEAPIALCSAVYVAAYAGFALRGTKQMKEEDA